MFPKYPRFAVNSIGVLSQVLLFEYGLAVEIVTGFTPTGKRGDPIVTTANEHGWEIFPLVPYPVSINV
jgi:hypothetical protein